MLSESRVRELAIRWYFLALLAQKESAKKAAPIFSKAHAFIYVLEFPSDISCGKKSEDGLKLYAEKLLEAWLYESTGDAALIVNDWLGTHASVNFEEHI
jgi:hypothetical protein